MGKDDQRKTLLAASKRNAELMKEIVNSNTEEINRQQDRYVDRLFWISNLILGGSIATIGYVNTPFEAFLFINILTTSTISVFLGLQNYHLIDKFFAKDIKIVNKNWKNWVGANNHILNPEEDPTLIFNKSTNINQKLNDSREDDSPTWAIICQEITILLSAVLYVILLIYKVDYTTGIFKILKETLLHFLLR